MVVVRVQGRVRNKQSPDERIALLVHVQAALVLCIFTISSFAGMGRISDKLGQSSLRDGWIR